MFDNVYKDKKVLVTGNTGFKGSWLTTWLLHLGATVIGISKDIPTTPSMFEELNLSKKIKFFQEDIRDLSKMVEIISTEKPDFLFHLAAQPIVSVSYDDPIETISSNVMGTTNILEALKKLNHSCVAVLITSDKGYENVEQVWGYKENDQMGGKDIYSGSKGATELIIKSYFHSFFKKPECNIRMAVCRAGNVIGGGDWAKDRIVVDCMTSWNENKTVKIRNPNSTRPWQHVLEPLGGYLTLGSKLSKNNRLHGESFNFGPAADQNHTVEDLLIDLSQYWNLEHTDIFEVIENTSFDEAGLLKLNCDKSLFYLNWKSNLMYLETIKFTSEWYYGFYKQKKDMFDFTSQQINEYESLGKNRGLKWME